MIPDKLFVPQKTEAEKLQSIDISIESCLKILMQELNKRRKIQGKDKLIVSITVEQEDEMD